MSDLLSIDEADIAASIIPMLEKFQSSIDKAEPLFKIHGEKLETLARDLPYHQRHYADLAAEAKALVKWLENQRARTEAKLTKNYLHGQRVYGARETTTLISGEREMIEHNVLIIEATLRLNRLDAIVDGFGQMGWMIGNMVKLRVADMHTAVI